VHHGRVELLDLLENGMGAREVARACLGRADVARGPAQQRDAQHPLQIGHMAADGGRRQVELARGGGEASGPRDLDEDGHGSMRIQGSCPYIRDDQSRDCYVILQIGNS
jgi:hypothetical protein